MANLEMEPKRITRATTKKNNVPIVASKNRSYENSTPQTGVSNGNSFKKCIRYPSMENDKCQNLSSSDESVSNLIEQSILYHSISAPNLSQIADVNTSAYKDKIQSLELELQSAHNEIDNLNEENQLLKLELTKSNTLLNRYKELYTEILTSGNYLKRKQFIELSDTPKSSKNVTIREMNQSNLIRSNTIKNHKSTLSNGTPKHSNLAKSSNDTPKCTNLSKNENKSKIIILGDQSATGLTYRLSSLLHDDYCKVQGFIKENASLKDVISNIHNLSKTMTKKDHFVISAGSNDKNPLLFTCELAHAFRETTNTNLHIVSVAHGHYLNTTMLNLEIQKFIPYFPHASFISTQTPLFSKFNSYLADNIKKSIKKKDYYHTFLSYNNKKPTETFRQNNLKMKLQFKTINRYPISEQSTNTVTLGNYNQEQNTSRNTINFYFKQRKEEPRQKEIKCNSKITSIEPPKGTIEYYFNKKSASNGPQMRRIQEISHNISFLEK